MSTRRIFCAWFLFFEHFGTNYIVLSVPAGSVVLLAYDPPNFLSTCRAWKLTPSGNHHTRGVYSYGCPLLNRFQEAGADPGFNHRGVKKTLNIKEIQHEIFRRISWYKNCKKIYFTVKKKAKNLRVESISTLTKPYIFVGFLENRKRTMRLKWILLPRFFC